MFLDEQHVYELTTFTRVCFPLKDHPWPDIEFRMREVVRENRNPFSCQCFFHSQVNDKYITICRGKGEDDVPKKLCFSLDPDLGTWNQIEMEKERKAAGYSLYGEGDDMLISGGNSLDNSFTHKDLEIVGEGKPPSVSVESKNDFSEKYNVSKFNVSNLLTRSEVENFTLGNYWLAEQQGEFTLDLGTFRPVDMVELVNTHNADFRDKAMKEFKVYLSEGEWGPWDRVVHETLEDTRQQSDPLPVQTFKFSERIAKFVMFKTKSGYGTGGGLQYFAVTHSG